MKLFVALVLLAASFTRPLIAAEPATSMRHPGSWITQEGCDRIRKNVAAGREPWKTAWTALENSEAKPNYRPNGDAEVKNSYAIQNDGHAAWVLAVKWVASADLKYAEGAIRILDAWSAKNPCRTIPCALGSARRR